MIRKITQIRMGQEYINKLTFSDDWSNNIIPVNAQVVQLGIYAMPGTAFKINQVNSSKVETLVINGSGLFSIDVQDRPIRLLQISKKDTDKITSSSHFVVIDMVYEEGGIINE